MHRTANALIITLTALPGVAWSSSANVCGAAQAVGLAQRVFEHHRDFHFKAAAAPRALATPAFLAALDNHYRCQKENGLCHIEYDPWLGAQDGEIGGPVSYAFQSGEAGKAGVTVGYGYRIADNEPPQRKRVIMPLESAAPPQCWRLADFVTPLGDSLLERFRAEP